jgi:hypothetical protein
MPVVGRIETLAGRKLRGWAARLEGSEYTKVILDITLNGIVRGQVLSNNFREDLLDAGIGDGSHAFEFDLSQVEDIPEGDITVEARETISGELIPSISGAALIYSGKPRISKMILGDVIRRVEVKSAFDPSRFRKIALYAVYSKVGALYKFHHLQVEALKKAGYYVVLIRALDTAVEATSNCHLQIDRRNVGHDFGSWWAAVLVLVNAHPEIHSEIDHILLLNDSCFGLHAGIQLARAERQQADLVGICDSLQERPHIQSFFFLVGKNFLRSGEFTRFITEYSFPDTKMDVVFEGEINLTTRARAHGGACHALVDYTTLAEQWISSVGMKINRSIKFYREKGFSHIDQFIEEAYFRIVRQLEAGKPLNPTHYFWEEIIASGFGIVKKELIIRNPENIPDAGLRLQIARSLDASDEMSKVARAEHNQLLL